MLVLAYWLIQIHLAVFSQKHWALSLYYTIWKVPTETLSSPFAQKYKIGDLLCFLVSNFSHVHRIDKYWRLTNTGEKQSCWRVTWDESRVESRVMRVESESSHWDQCSSRVKSRVTGVSSRVESHKVVESCPSQKTVFSVLDHFFIGNCSLISILLFRVMRA